MENRFTINGDTVTMEIPYKDTVILVFFDKDDLSLAQSISGRWLISYKDVNKTYFYVVSNKDKKIALHKLISNASADDKVYFKDKDHTNLRKNNLSLNTFEVDDSWRESKREGYKNMSPEKRANLLLGMKRNRYTKDWSDQLATHKKGKKNPNTVLNERKVRQIREDYAVRKITQQMLGEKYGVGRTTIADIVNYRTWNEIGEDKNKTYRIYEENHVIPLDLKVTPIQEYEFTNSDIPLMDFVIELQERHSKEYIFFQKIGRLKLYVEARDEQKEFIHSFEVVFPEFLTEQHIHNYVIAQRRPVRYMNRHEIHGYMKILSTYLFGESYKEKDFIDLNWSE